ncbi:phosphonate ABC transporter ATP-binding protein [Natronorubrum sp. DTA7]|uniref:phosphonate ABC transporter ATP-binding protein n=1 Tax=Natronorubrum sp. DTA7 TaxID=3447016 RepID=UPI003F851E92
MAVLELRDLEKTYDDGTEALTGVDLTVDGSEFVAVIGSSGAGKSTMLRCVNQLVEPTGGDCLFRGTDLTDCSSSDLQAARRDIGMVFQQFNLVDRLTAIENVMVGDLSELGLFQMLLKRFPKASRQEAYELLDYVGIGDQAGQRADTLSGGQQQRVALARMMYQEPDLIVADEPIASLDPQSAETVMNQLQSYCKTENVPVLVNLHQVDTALEYADRVVGLSDGATVYDGSPERLDEDAIDQIYADGTDPVDVDPIAGDVTAPPASTTVERPVET